MAGSKKTTSSKKEQAVATAPSTTTEKTQTKKTKTKTSKAKETVEVQETQPETQQTQEGTESKFDATFQQITSELKELKDRCSSLTTVLRKLESYHRQDIKKVRKHKQKRNGQHKATGFAKPQPVPEKLAKFIGVTAGTELTGPQITSAVWKQLKQRNLTYADDKRVFRTNKEVSSLFNVPSSVNNSTDHRDEHGFNFCNLQTYIAHALKQ